MTGYRARRLAALAALALVLAGCAAPGGGAGTHNDVGRCAAVLPLAEAVLHGRGTLTVVRPVTRDDVDAISAQAGVAPLPKATRPPGPPPQRGQQDPGTGPPLPHACLVVYHGDYPAGSVPQALAPAVSGQYALVVARVRQPSVIRVLVLPTLPSDTRPRPWWKLF